ncbi:uncharacterized protein K452DRAFT_278940 [Aplosporella prunicola CBS 121167]|uniref:Major facilitator superfamily (MFS) profile domain-containing protein n=1 Tax=Aplosporella prunicola CBS 121167 TaxID=1176127 RepID=A0A6A6B1N2_9PEZI|nr:uncharacterized protein K452DRAFT_278940 [Aplosporella prunicola CBS 121167]KAF2137134.1 hypothetical protein K452DRAFT_278940 [Aplosporella prunicola CBS 121167]
MARNSSSAESVVLELPKDEKAHDTITPSMEAQQTTSFAAEPIPKDGFHVHTRESGSSSGCHSGYSDNHVFSDPTVAEYYMSVYEKADYECRHEFDPKFEWTPEEEKALIRKLDWRVCAWACVMFFGLQVDRGNLKQAVSDNMLDDLNLSTNDYNFGNTIFLISFLLAELPSQLVSKKLGPDRWIPLQITLWSIVAICQCALTGKRSFYATRSMLGLLEGGFIPDIVLWLSYFYTSRELPTRLSFFWTALSTTMIVTSLLAFALLHMRGVSDWAGWRWLFLIEGLITLVVGLSSFFMMPASAVQTKTWFRPKGWFNDRELKIAVNRVLRDDPSKGDMHNRQAITPKRLWNAAKDYDLWPIYAIGLLAYTPQGAVEQYITLTLKSVGFSTFNTNLLAIPYNVFHIILLLTVTRISEWLNSRALVAVWTSVWTLPCVIALRYWPGTMVNGMGTYALVTVLLSAPYCHAIVVAWTSKNSNNVGTRTVSAAMYNMTVQLGNIISANVYRENDKPLYHKGNRSLLVINVIAIATFLFAKGYYVWRNKSRDKKWQAMSAEQRAHYIKTTTDRGSKRLDFRFAH